MTGRSVLKCGEHLLNVLGSLHGQELVARYARVGLIQVLEANFASKKVFLQRLVITKGVPEKGPGLIFERHVSEFLHEGKAKLHLVLGLLLKKTLRPLLEHGDLHLIYWRQVRLFELRFPVSSLDQLVSEEV